MFGRLNNKCFKITIALLITSLISCGSNTTSNDQGTSFLAFGFFTDVTGSTGQTGSILPMFTDVPVGNIDGLYEIIYLGLENKLSKQTISVSRIDCDYSVDGSFLDIPSDSFPGNQVLSPTGTDGSTTGVVKGYTGFLILSPDIFSYLNNNKAYLPELPFRMTASCSATGVTQAGDVITSNSLSYFIQFVDQAECCTGTGDTPGFQTGPGTGGDLIIPNEETTGGATSSAQLLGTANASENLITSDFASTSDTSGTTDAPVSITGAL